MGTKDCTLGIFTMASGALWSMNINWALPVVWPGAVYGLEIGIVGTRGVIDIEDTHRDVILAAEESQGPGYNPKGYDPGFARNVDFLGSYPPGDLHEGRIAGPMREETLSWLDRLVTGRSTVHATAADGHRNLLLTMAMDLSARTGAPVKLPVDPALLARPSREARRHAGANSARGGADAPTTLPKVVADGGERALGPCRFGHGRERSAPLGRVSDPGDGDLRLVPVIPMEPAGLEAGDGRAVHR